MTLKTVNDYVALIEPQHADKPRYIATVSLLPGVLAQFQAFLASMPQAFDIDFAVGVQLDAVGVRVGRSRLVTHPLQGIYFSLDNTLLGLDRGVWKGPYDTGVGIYQLDDDTYRRLLYAKVIANSWDGTIEGQQAIYNAYFVDPATLVFVVDSTVSAPPTGFFSLDNTAQGLDQGIWAPAVAPLVASYAADMRMTVGIAGTIPSLTDLAILSQDLVGAKPEGVTVYYEITSSNGAPIFGLDVDNDYVSGLDQGAWGVSPAYLTANLPS